MIPSNIFFILICLFFAITFLESAIDKIVNRAGNLAWIQAHFSKTFLNSFSKSLFYILTIQELLVGLTMLAAIFGIVLNLFNLVEFGLYCSLFVLIQLFAGQRIAKDYAGASGIIPYIVLAVIAIIASGTV